MYKNKIIITVLIAIIAVLLVGMVAMMANISKQETKLTFEGNSTITEGNSIKIKLTDDNGNALTNQFVNVTITDENKASDYHSVVTDDNGIGTFTLDKKAGNYTITVTYGGNESYAGCNATKKVTIKEETAEVAQSSSSSTNNGGSGSSSASGNSGSASSSSSNKDPGAFYSPQEDRVLSTGEVIDTPGGPRRHTGNGNFEPA